MPLWQTHHGNNEIKKKKNENNCDLWVPLKTVGVYTLVQFLSMYYKGVCVCVRLHVYCTPWHE